MNKNTDNIQDNWTAPFLTKHDLNKTIEIALAQDNNKRLFMAVNPATDCTFYFAEKDGNVLTSTTSLSMALGAYNNA